jgi:hypothetical protein
MTHFDVLLMLKERWKMNDLKRQALEADGWKIGDGKITFKVDGGFISAEELAEVLKAKNRADLLIGGFVNKTTQTITLWRGNLESLTVPFSAFEKSGEGTVPDFNSFSVIDCGQTIKLGNYEAAVDAILYEYLPMIGDAADFLGMSESERQLLDLRVEFSHLTDEEFAQRHPIQ